MRVIDCSIESCEETAFIECTGEKGGAVYSGPLCKKHYARLKRLGDPLAGRKIRKDAGISSRVVGSVYPKGDGYNKVWDPEHPNAHRNGFVAEHTRVMSEILGRPLRKGESVHHLNGVRDDNRPENLELWAVPPRKNVRHEDAIKDCISFLEENGYTVSTGLRTCE